MKKILVLISLALLIVSCEESEIDIQKLEPTDFKITVNSGKESFIINETIEYNLLIEPIKPITEKLTYTLKLFDNGIQGEFSINGNTYLPEESITSLQEGYTSIKYTGNKTGSGDIVFEITASNGISKSVSAPITIQNTDFDFEVLFDKSKNYIHEKTSFNIIIEKRGIEPLTYKAYFKNIEGEIELDEQDETILQNRRFDLSEGITFGEFTGTLVQEDDIEFVVEASNGSIKTQTINFKTLLTDFEVVMTPDPMTNFYLSDLNFTYLIQRPENLEQEIEYYLYITSIGLGSLMYTIQGNENSTIQGFERNIGNRISNEGELMQLGRISPRKGTVTFHFRDSNGATYEKTIDVDYYE
ncbi:hypothetical protein [Aquimarina algiphila]|uniref:hypothetical protein n=1 Tax=Aquimarina algiphila TaxID=2047982 RepID=UPI00232FF5BF|nr:hypothetical protein [Aquimarina algiphila]